MQQAYEIQSDSHEAQIEGLKEIHKQEIRKKQKLMEEHMESIAAIEEDYENALEMIEQLREELIIDIENRFGIQYAP